MKKKLYKAAGLAITFAAFAFFIRAIVKMHIDFSSLAHPAVIGCGLLLAAAYAATVYVSAYAWKLVLEYIHGSAISYKALAGVYAKANIGKYLPGNVMHFAGRNILAGKLGFRQLDIAFSSIVEVVALILTASFWSLLLAMRSFTSLLRQAAGSIGQRGLAAAGIALAVLCAAAAFWVFHSRRLEKYRHFIRKGLIRLAARLFFIYSLTMIIPGLFLAVIFGLLGCGLTPAALPVIISAYTVSWVAGFIVPGAPGGLGVREAVALIILSPYFEGPVILLALIILRLVSMFGDAIAFFMVALIQKLAAWPKEPV